jgi:hypothetical protein
MDILAYGEDALTLWAIKEKLSDILEQLGQPKDYSSLEKCKVFFRPSFGRKGGDKSPEFGEFDFIILYKDCLYLGESKWDDSKKNFCKRALILKDNQINRHRIFKACFEERQYTSWDVFAENVVERLKKINITKPKMSDKHRLADNLKTVLNVIKKHYGNVNEVKVKNVLLYLHCGVIEGNLPIMATNKNNEFKFDFVAKIDYSKAKSDELGNFIRLQL